MQIQTIPLAQLKHSKLNVRRTGGKSVDELAASIRAIGLQQNLGVVQAGKGYEVVFGGRRLRAIQALAKAGELPESLAEGIPCTVLSAEEAHEASLAENTLREAMHPLDQFRAFAEMAEAGKPVADIAAAFGVTERVVEGRMRLARVSPKLLKVYGEGGMTLEQLQAFAVTDDHAAQEHVWKAASYDYAREPAQLRRELLSRAVTDEDVRVRLVGLEAYEAAGGAVKRDLFSDTVLVLDEGLLDRLVEQKLAEVVEAVKAEGWSWVEVGERPRWDAPCIQPAKDRAEDDELTPNEIAAMDAAAEAGDALAVDAIEEAARTWPEGAKERAGAVVYLGYNGVVIYRGILRDGEAFDQGGDDEDEDEEGLPEDPAPPQKAERDPAAWPGNVVADLTRMRTGELRVAMIRDPQKAVLALTAHLAEDWRMEYGTHASGITIHHHKAPEIEGYTAAAELWRKRLSFDGPVLDWLVQQPWDTVLVLLAFLVSESVDIVVSHPSMVGKGNALCTLFGLDLSRTWRPDAELLKRVPGPAILAALEEAGMPESDLAACRKLKKAELAGRAAGYLANTTWMPECLRLPAPAKAEKRKAAHGKAAAAGDEGDGYGDS